MAAAAAIAGLAGTGIQMYGQYEAGQANKRSNEFNANMSDIQAIDSLQRGEEAAGASNQDMRRLAGRQRVAIASQGIDLSSPLAQSVQLDTERSALSEANAIRANAARAAFGYRAQAIGMRRAGTHAYNAGNFNMAGQAIAGGAQSAAMFRDYQRNG